MIPSGLNVQGLVPLIIVSDLNDNELYRFEPKLSVSSGDGVRDFDMTGFHLHGGVGTDLGRLIVDFADKNNLFTDTTDLSRPSTFPVMGKVDLWMFHAGSGTNPATDTAKGSLPTANKWFSGYVLDPSVIRPVNNFQQQSIFSVGVGLELAERLTSIKKVQRRDINGLDFDPTDLSTTAYNLAIDLLTKTYHFPHQGLPALTGFGITEIDTSIVVQFADFVKRYIPIYSALQEIANRSGQIWGIRPENGNVFMHIRGTKSSGILCTNDLSGYDATNWDSDKLCILRNNPTGYSDSGVGAGYSIIHGVGGTTDFLMLENTTADSALSLSTDDQFAFPFIPTEDSISRLGVFLSRNGTATTPLVISIMGYNVSLDEPNEDLRRRIIIPAEFLNDNISPSGTWFEHPLQTINAGTRVTPQGKFMVVFDKHNQIRVDYDGVATDAWWSKSGGTWTKNSGANGALPKWRIYHSHSLDIIIENITAVGEFGIREIPLPLNDFPSEQSAIDGLIGYSKIIGKTQRMYRPLQVTPPSYVPKLGKMCKIYDKFNGMSVDAEMVGYDIQATSQTNWNRGINSMTLHVESV